jgi:DNA sulfur modification protein DndB
MFYKANRRILGHCEIGEDTHTFLVNYWRAVSEHMHPWNEMDQRRLSKRELREQTIAVQAVCLQALGRVGAVFYSQGLPFASLENLETINWYRSSPKWLHRTIRDNGRIITNNQAVCLTANVIKKALQIPLSDEDIQQERKLMTRQERGQRNV